MPGKNELSFIIREATVDDARGLTRVHVDAWHATYQGIVPQAFLDTLTYERGEPRWRDRLSATDRTDFIYVATDATGEVVGFAAGGPDRQGHLDYPGELYAIYIHPMHQKRGIGRRIIAAVAERFAQQGIESMRVWVLSQNPSRHFYEALGGQPIEEKAIEIGGALLPERSYGWPSTRELRAFGLK